MLRRALLLIFPLLCSSLVAQTEDSIKPQLDSLFQVHFKKGFNGNFLYAKGDRIVHSGNFGRTKYEGGIPINDSTLFELGSNAKQFTALAKKRLH